MDQVSITVDADRRLHITAERASKHEEVHGGRAPGPTSRLPHLLRRPPAQIYSNTPTLPP